MQNKLVFLFCLLFTSSALADESLAYTLMSPVVRVRTERDHGGSGTIIADGKVATCAHVVGNRSVVMVDILTWNKEKTRITGHYTVTALVKKRDIVNDLAILILDGLLDLPIAPTAPDADLYLLQPTYTAGAAYMNDTIVFDGYVMDQENKGFIQTSNEVQPGCSGGPLWAKIKGKWKVIGIVKAAIIGAPMCMSIPISALMN